MSGVSEQVALQSIHAAAYPISPVIQKKLKGQKMALVANISSIDKGTGVTTFLKPLFGNVNTLVYTLKVN